MLHFEDVYTKLGENSTSNTLSGVSLKIHIVFIFVKADLQKQKNLPFFSNFAPIICFTGHIDTNLSDKYSIRILRIP
jgi:multisubunit Na+/H+ antiporter MnhG subunit